MRAIVAIIACAALVAAGATLAVASGGGHTRGNPSHHQYKAKPACKQHKARPARSRQSGSRAKRVSKASSYKGRGHCPNGASRRR